jgi:hypothetical protein
MGFEMTYSLPEKHCGNVSSSTEAIGSECSHLYHKLRLYGLEMGK